MGVVVSSLHVVSAFLLRGRTPHTLPLLQHEGSSHRRQFSTNFSNMSPSHGLQLFTNCPFHEEQSFRNRLLQHGSPAGSQALPANLLWRGLLSPQVHRSWQEPAPAWGSSQGHGFLQASTYCRWISAPPWPSMGCRGTTCLTMVFITSYKGRLSILTFQAPPPPSFFTDLDVCRVVSLTLSHSSLYPAVSPAEFFLPFLKYFITELLPPSLIGLALASGGSILEPADTGFYQTCWQLLAASHRSHPSSPPATKTLPRKPITCHDV